MADTTDVVVDDEMIDPVTGEIVDQHDGPWRDVAHVGGDLRSAPPAGQVVAHAARELARRGRGVAVAPLSHAR